MRILFALLKILKLKYLTLFLLIFIFSCQKQIKNAQSNKPNSTLQNTYWKVNSIGDKIIKIVENQRELHFVLMDDSDNVHGHSGCNTFNGKYKLIGKNGIEFSKMISTRMYCPDYEGEPLWFDFIDGPLSLEIKGEELILINNKKTKVKCQAIYLK